MISVFNTVAISNCLSIQANEPYVLALTPRNETKALEFIEQNPEADGRGVIIAIFDTGVDPGAPGLVQTSDGKIKVIERYDCSGSGDVDTSTVVAPVQGEYGLTLKGLTGRSFLIPPDWNNPSGKYHIGFKPVYELYPKDLLERMEKERREKYWETQQEICIGLAYQNLESYKNSMSSSTPDSSIESKFQKEDLESKFDTLIELGKTYKDLGPVLDCILYQNDKNIWQICLTFGNESILLREYNYTHEYSTLLPGDQFNTSVNVWNDGNLLEIVGLSGTHGSHVAAIASANFPFYPQLNGVAPGAQIVSLTIGDERLYGNQETSAALTRAMTRVMKDPKIHIINMSFGERSGWAPKGQLAKMMCDMVDKYGIVWTASAGNDGPCLSTVDSPAWICDDCIIAVGAYVSPEMMPALYSHDDDTPGMPYTWSSRGPAPDGGIGVNVSAPGGAITSVPNYTLQSAEFMNGTSMSAPHCAGCVALLISKAIQQNIAWTPYSIKRSLENTAINIEYFDPLAQGAGLIQIPQAYELLEYLSPLVDKFVRFNVECSGGLPGLPMRGIYIRDPPLEFPKPFRVYVTPKFFKEKKMDSNTKIMFKQHLTLTCTEHWVKIPRFLEIHNCENDFKVIVDPLSLSPGIHYARINAIDEGDLYKGPLFSVDVTIVVPIPICHNALGIPLVNFGKLDYPVGALKHFFIRPPVHSTWGVLNFNSIPNCGTLTSSHESRFIIQTHTLTPGKISKLDDWRIIKLRVNEEEIINFSVMGGKVIEIVVGRWWQDNEMLTLTSFVKFHGITIDKPMISACVSEAVVKVELSSHLDSEKIEPDANLTHLVQLLYMTDTSIRALGGRRDEKELGKPIYELRISYQFEILHETEIMIECPHLCSHLYECEYLAQLWMLFDHNKMYLTGGAAFPERFKYDLSEGNYTLHLHIRHYDICALHRFMPSPARNSIKEKKSQIPLLPLHLKMKMPKIPLGVFSTLTGALHDPLDDDHCVGSLNLRPNSSVDCYVRVLITDEDLKNLPSKCGIWLEGQFTASDNIILEEYSKSDIKVFLPNRVIELTQNEEEEESEPDEDLTPHEIYKISVELSENTESEELDKAIEFVLGKNYYGIGVKLLTHKIKHFYKSWNIEWHLKLRDCYVQLGWTHCVYFLDTNSLVQNPPSFRIF